MNRAQRRLYAAQRPGQFVGELQRRADQRAYEQAMRAQMQREANGEPIPPEIAAQMTKPREMEPLFQLGVTETEGGKTVFLGPMMGGDAIGTMVEAVNRQILAGQRSDWIKAEAYPMTRIQESGA
jgi:hypothetical protein